MKAYIGAVDPRYNELLDIAEDPERSLSRDDLGLGDDRRDGQLFFVLTLLLKDPAMDNHAKHRGNTSIEDNMSGDWRKAPAKSTETSPTILFSMLTAMTLTTRCSWKSARSSVPRST